METDSPSPIQMSETLQGARWQIEYFEDEGVDDTDDFENWQLEFSADGQINAFFNENLIATGTWRSVRDDGQTELWIALPALGELEELNEDWYLTEQTETLLKLEDRGDDYVSKLHLKRIYDYP
jgi:hypothetical protein